MNAALNLPKDWQPDSTPTVPDYLKDWCRCEVEGTLRLTLSDYNALFDVDESGGTYFRVWFPQTENNEGDSWSIALSVEYMELSVTVTDEATPGVVEIHGAGLDGEMPALRSFNLSEVLSDLGAIEFDDGGACLDEWADVLEREAATLRARAKSLGAGR